MRVRLRETIGYRSFTHFDGNMLQPDLTIQTAGIDQVVALAATDRIGRLQNGRKFISTLAEYIVYNGGSTLKAYWPLDESRAPFRDVVGGQAQLDGASRRVGYPGRRVAQLHPEWWHQPARR